MASQACIIAHKNQFNAAILEEDAYYFQSADEVKSILNNMARKVDFVQQNFSKIKEKYAWQIINRQYLTFFDQITDR